MTSDVAKTVEFRETDDLNLCLYYIKGLSTILRWAPASIWAVLAKHRVSDEPGQQESEKNNGKFSLLLVRRVFMLTSVA